MLMNMRHLAKISFIISVIFLIIVFVTLILPDLIQDMASAGIFDVSVSNIQPLINLSERIYPLYYLGVFFLITHTLLMLTSIYKEKRWGLFFISILIPPAPTLAYYIKKYSKT